MTKFIIQPYDKVRVGDLLIEGLENKKWIEFQAIVAFVKRSGMKHIFAPLSKFSQRGKVLICAGISQGGTTVEGLQMLLDSVGDKNELYVFHNRNNSTFHPKLYVFKNKKSARVIVGSNNLTEGGIYTNYEAAVVMDLQFNNSSDRRIIKNIDTSIRDWKDTKSSLSIALSTESLQRLIDNKFVPTEKQAREKMESVKEVGEKRLDTIFGSKPVPKAPKVLLDRKYIKPDEEDVDNETQNEVLPKQVYVNVASKGSEEPRIILIKYVPKAGNRTSQVHFTLDNMENYFHLKTSQHIRILQKQPNEKAKEVESRQLVLSPVNKNAKIEIGGARILVESYPEGDKKPILIFKKIGKDSYEYMLLLPADEGYLPVSEYLNALPKGKALASDTISLSQMKQVWEKYPTD